MSSLSQLRMLGIDDLTWPVTYRYNCQGGSGWTSWEMSVDVPALNGLKDETIALGDRLFASTIATAICSSIDLVYYDYTIHKLGPAVSIAGGFSTGGRQFGTPAPRNHSGVVGFNTEHDDSYGRRRHYLFGMPNNWQDANGLTDRGWDGCMNYAHLLAMGLSGAFGAGMMQLLIAYWGVLPFSVPNVFGVAFRRVASYNVFQHTDKAPDGHNLLWPPTAP
jgi:hypothetical protein